MTCYGDHPSLDVLELYLLNRTDESKTEQVEEHLLICGSCRTMAESLEREIEVIREALSEEEEENRVLTLPR